MHQKCRQQNLEHFVQAYIRVFFLLSIWFRLGKFSNLLEIVPLFLSSPACGPGAREQAILLTAARGKRTLCSGWRWTVPRLGVSRERKVVILNDDIQRTFDISWYLFPKEPIKIRPISRPEGPDMRYVFRVQSLNKVLTLFLSRCVQYRAIFDCHISGVFSTYSS